MLSSVSSVVYADRSFADSNWHVFTLLHISWSILWPVSLCLCICSYAYSMKGGCMCSNINAWHEFSIRFLRFLCQPFLMSDNHQPKVFCTENNFVPLDGGINQKVTYGLRCVSLNDVGTLLESCRRRNSLILPMAWLLQKWPNSVNDFHSYWFLHDV